MREGLEPTPPPYPQARKGPSVCCCRLIPNTSSRSEDRRQRTEDRKGVAWRHPNLSSLFGHPFSGKFMLGGHSELDPRLPIPNRTVKRLCADDSADYPRESRSPPGALYENAHPHTGWAFLFGGYRDLLSGRKRACPWPHARVSVQAHLGLCPR